MPRTLTRLGVSALLLLLVIQATAVAGGTTPADTSVRAAAVDDSLRPADDRPALVADQRDLTPRERDLLQAVAAHQPPPRPPSVVEAVASSVLDALDDGNVPVVFVAGIAHRDERDPLENETRRKVYEAVTDAPGVNVTSVAADLDLAWTTVRYHVRVLEHHDVVVSAKIRGQLRLYPAEEGDPELVAALDDEATVAVLNALVGLEPATVSELADAVDRAPSTVSYHLTRMADQDLVERERVGATVVTRLDGSVKDALTQEQSTATEDD